MSARDLLRTFIARTNPYWPFTWCNQVPYRLAVRALQRMLHEYPEIESAWIWHDRWIPAMSDIDVSIVIQHRLTTEHEYEFLESFWARFDRLKTFFPIIEVKILSEDELPVWLCHADSGHPDHYPVFLHGKRYPDSTARRFPAWRQFALGYALWVYVSLLPPCFAVPNSFLRRQDIQRRIRKILRLLKPVLSEAGRGRDVPGPYSMADAILALEHAVRHLDSIKPCDAGEPGWLLEGEGSCTLLPDGPPLMEGVRSIVRNRAGVVFVVVEDGLGREVLQHIIQSGHVQKPVESRARVVLPQCVFAYMIRTNNPYDYVGLLSKRTIESGTDPLTGMQPPGRAAFVSFTLSRIAHALTFTRGEEVFSRLKPFSVATCEPSLENAMAVRLMLRDNWVSPQRRETAARWRSEFPECAVALEQIKRDAAEGRERAARRGLFLLFRQISRDILDYRDSFDQQRAAGGEVRFEKS